MTQPNPIRTLPSHGVEDQTSDEWVNKKSCLRTNSGAPVEVIELAHHMVSIKTGSEMVPYVEQCTDCDWIDPASLTWWAENAIKVNMNARSQRIAIASETDPFAFVQQRGEVLTLEEIIFQALGAASVCWVGGTGDAEFDSSRAKAIAEALIREVDNSLATVQQLARGPFVELSYELYALACNSRSLDPAHEADWKAAFERIKAQFNKLLGDAPEPSGKVDSGVDGAATV